MATENYSKSKMAASLGITPDEFKRRAKKAGFSSTEEYWNYIGGASAPLIEAISKQMVDMDRQIEELAPYLSLSAEEKQAFLDKALQEITPYYDRKTAELNASLQAGKVRTAEDILNYIRTTEEETTSLLSKYNLESAQNEEEFINRIADITSTKGEDIAAKTEDYRQRMEILKFDQIQKGVLTSGIGAKTRAEQDAQKQMQLSQIERGAQAQTTTAETTQKYNIEQIQLARQAAEQARVRAIGTPAEVDYTKQQAMQTAGITDPTQLKSPQELARLRAESGVVSETDASKLTELEAEKLRAREATAQELQAGELGIKEAQYGMTRDQILAERAKKAAQVAALNPRGY